MRTVARSRGAGVPQTTRLFAAAALLAVLPLSAVANENQETTTTPETWWASLGVEGGTFVHQFDGDVRSSPIVNPPIDNPQPIRPPASGSSTYVAPLVAGSLEVFGPEFWRVRPFAGAHVGGEFGVTRDLAKERTTGVFEKPPGFPPADLSDTGAVEDSIRGQGSRVSVRMSDFFFGASAGASFAVRAGGRNLRIKPSFEYLWEEVEVKGTVKRAVLLEEGVANSDPGFSDFRLIDLQRETKRVFHGVGPGFEVDTDLTRQGKFVASVFASGAAYFWLGDRKVDIRATNTQGEFADFSVKRDPVSFRAQVGVRLRFEP